MLCLLGSFKSSLDRMKCRTLATKVYILINSTLYYAHWGKWGLVGSPDSCPKKCIVEIEEEVIDMESKTIAPIVISIVAIIIAGAALSASYKTAPAPQVPPTPGGFDNKTPIKTTHNSLTLDQIAEIQPGLGTVMMEYGNRFYMMYYAAKSGNWDLAQYQLKEALEIQEVGETTRTGRAASLKNFEASYLAPLNTTMNTKNWNAFQTAYNNTIDGCNGCHVANGFPYIKYTLPSSPPNIP
jgi:hypothetical protein